MSDKLTKNQIGKLIAEFKSQVEQAGDMAALEAVRISILGKKGALTQHMRSLGNMQPEERTQIAPALNRAKVEIGETIEARREKLAKSALASKLAEERVDITLPPLGRYNVGAIHPVSRVTEEIVSIFSQMGFAVREGPEIESDYYNFEALNFPPEHPARLEHDTFFLQTDSEESRLLRTHTSTVQIRTLQAEGPPVRFIAPGRVYRCDYDQTHTPMFHQYEGMVVDKQVSMAQLKWVLEEFCRAFFVVDDIELRFRASHFPFTEPSAEVDIRCSWRDGQVLVGEGDDWLEILGSGMIHPNVLKACNVDPDKWSGFAFGMGIDRLAMLKYGMPDLRAFFDGDLRWLRHYGFSPFSAPSAHAGLEG